MADDWEQEDWEADDFKPSLPSTATAQTDEFETAGQAVLAKLHEPDMSKFADEDTQQEEEITDYSIKPQPKKKVEKKYDKVEEEYVPLDDPVEEKLRQQRLVEEADLRAAQELFGGSGKGLDGMLPKTLKDFEDYADNLVGRYVAIHKDSKNYRAFLKAVIKKATEHLTGEDTKELENAIMTIRMDKQKAEKAAAAGKTKAKKNLNVGRDVKGSSKSAGLDDEVYGDIGVDDDFDFM